MGFIDIEQGKSHYVVEFNIFSMFFVCFVNFVMRIRAEGSTPSSQAILSLLSAQERLPT